ncbi:hypothetical protein GCM10007877_03790 [Marinibactrum halimedae]|uniref:Uncharacterized protein n=2 Tax=Marinibactrum halimedae TaxID=1444977 RepID=A0AA37WKX5_9GAMM|nr:hypothetical protein GCM10007877_03790 [Marinibactrum halimedae]
MHISGCATQNKSPNVVVASLSIGVEKNIESLISLSNSLFYENLSPAVLPYSIEYRSSSQLYSEFAAGNYDVILGVVEASSAGYLIAGDIIPLKSMDFQYFVLPERQDIRDVSNKDAFFLKTKAVGYVSVGKVGIANEAKIATLENSHSFTPCGTVLGCVRFLHEKKIDSMATFGLNSLKALDDALKPHGQRIVKASLKEATTYGVMLNSLTLSQEEMQSLRYFFTQAVLQSEQQRELAFINKKTSVAKVGLQ